MRAVRFDWDAGNREHIWKHGGTTSEAEEALKIRPLHVSTETRQKEARMFALGPTQVGRILAIIFTVRRHRVRVVTARDASRKERKKYAEDQKKREP